MISATQSSDTYVKTYKGAARKALAIHCSLAHSGAWAGVAKVLRDRVTLMAYDLPHHGRSGDWDGETDFHDLSTKMAQGVLKAPMDVIGHSFGATVALRLAIEHPEKVRTLTLIEPVFFVAAKADTPARFKAFENDMSTFATAAKGADWEAAARSFNHLWGDGTPWTRLPETLKAYMCKTIQSIPGTEPALYDDRARMLATGALEQAVMPTLLIEGGKSPDIIDAVNTALAQRLPDARRMIVDDAGHMCPITHPEQVGYAIANLLDMAEE